MARSEMTPRTIWKVEIATTQEAEEAVTELLENEFNTPVSSYTDVETGRVCVSVYLILQPKWASARRRLGAGMKRIRDCGIAIRPGRVVLRRIARRDWAEAWKKHFKPLEIRGVLLIKPSWSKRKPRKDQEVIVLDPGLSFGTGQHPTTGFCLDEIALLRTANPQSFLDIGTGSGILAIAAAKLGYRTVHAFDFDPDALRIAKQNARDNGVARRIKFWRGDIRKSRRGRAAQYDVICANLISTLLISERDRIVAQLKPGGALVLAGILREEFDQVARSYENAGMRLLADRTRGEWRSGLFRAAAAS